MTYSAPCMKCFEMFEARPGMVYCPTCLNKR